MLPYIGSAAVAALFLLLVFLIIRVSGGEE